MYISLNEYAAKHGRLYNTVLQKAVRGGFTTAKKIGRGWVIDSEEPYTDNRLRAKDVFSAEAETLDASTRSRILKLEQAKQYSGWRNSPDTCSAIFANIPEDWLDRYTAQQLGEIAALIKKIYDKGQADAKG